MPFQISRLSPVALAAWACYASVAHAQTQTIEITADKERYQPAITQTATRSDVPLEQVPLSIVSISRSVILAYCGNGLFGYANVPTGCQARSGAIAL
jgi:hypothetical protein